MSVRKRKWTTAKSEVKEAWQADYVDGQGNRQRQSFAKKKDADAFLLKAMGEVRDGVHVPDSETITVSAAGALWLKSGAADGLERTTLDQRRQHRDLHIVPFIGNTKLNKLTVPSIRAFQDTLRENGRSAAMIKRVTVSLGSILADAQLRGHAIRNPVHEMSRAKSSRTKLEKRQQRRLEVGIDIPTTAEVKALIGAATGRWRPLIITAVFTGLRASELRGLRWADVDFSGAMLHVRQRADRYHAIGMPKTDAGQRKVPLTPMTVNVLKEWKLACPKGEMDLVFPTGAGKVEGHSNLVNRGLIPTMISAGVTTVTGRDEGGHPITVAKYSGLHALRHWFASWCINRRADGGLELTPKAVQERMGHSNIAVTLDTYSHLFPVQDEQAALAAAERSIFSL
ncbi:tyrosine-type recombinase/integrase [Devosia sp. 2618]|uniref:tyrosine-type recombinase/integrase n=1 Tax=Devosia sp. 2618 TaxID=3156454 RepID=UPI003395B458